MDNYLKCKWIKCINRKTQTGWVDENRCMYALPLTTTLRLPKLYVIILYYHVNHVPIMAYNYLFCLAIDYETDKCLLL